MWNKARFKKIYFLPLFTLCFCLGICLVKFWYIPFMVLYLGCWIPIILSILFFKKEVSIWLLLILGIFLGALFLKNSYILPYSHISKFTFYKSKIVLLKGVVDNYPEVSSRYTSFVLAAEELTQENKVYRITGKVWVRVFRKENISYGQRILLKGKLYKPYGRISDRVFYRDYLKGQKIYSILTVSYNMPIKYLGFKKDPLKTLAYRVRGSSRNIYFKYLPSSQAGIFSAILLGDRSKINPYFRRLFVQTGTVHILAISGLHVGIVIFVFNLLLKASGLKRHLRFPLIIIYLIFYCLLTGSRASVIRATVMATVLLVGFFLKRQSRISHSLSLAALLILVVNPSQLFDIGFQLSFLSVIALVYLSPLIKKDLCNLKFNLYNQNKIFRFLISAFSASFAAWLGLIPFIFYYFKIINPVAIIANIIVVPYLALVIALGLTLLIMGNILPSLAPIFAGPANLSIIILMQITRFFNQIPFAYFYL